MSIVGERVKRIITFSELQAVKGINNQMGGELEAILVNKDIADKIGVTRSVMVNGLRLLEAAGILETKSLGMKGTNIKVLDKKVFEEIIK